MTYYDCPNCHNDQVVELEVKGDWLTRLGIRGRLSAGNIYPCVCLGCGTVYLDKRDIEYINKEVLKNQ
jgi:hypothetical protein